MTDRNPRQEKKKAPNAFQSDSSDDERIGIGIGKKGKAIARSAGKKRVPSALQVSDAKGAVGGAHGLAKSKSQSAKKPDQIRRPEAKAIKPKEKVKSSGWGFGSILRTFGLSRGNNQKFLNAKSKKLPKNFANMVLDQEMKIDSGQVNIDTVNSLMALYSQAVEYYSGMNDEKYIYFTERIQNILVKPEILRMMKDVNDASNHRFTSTTTDTTADTKSGGRKSKRHGDIDGIQDSALRVNLEDQLKRKKARAEKLAAAVQEEAVKDPIYQQDTATIEEAKNTAATTIRVLQSDAIHQKDALQARLAERKKRIIRANFSHNGLLFNTNPKGSASVLVKSLDDGLSPFLNNKFANRQVIGEGQLPTFGGGGGNAGNSGSNSNTTGAINSMLQKLDHNPGARGFQPGMATTNRYLVARPTNSRSILLQSNSPMAVSKNNPINQDFSYNFDIHSNKSAPFAKDEDMAEMEQQLQEKMQEVFTHFEGKQDKLQNEYQEMLETILEDVTQMKFEKMAEVKVAFKNMDQENEDNIKCRDDEIQAIKDETEAEKQRQIKSAQFTLETKKAQLQVEKVQALRQMKEEVRQAAQCEDFAEIQLEEDVEQIEPIPMVGDGGEMAPLRLQEYLAGNAPADLGPVAAGFGPAANERQAEDQEEDLGLLQRKHTATFNFDFAKKQQAYIQEDDEEVHDDEYGDEGDDFNPDATKLADLNEKKQAPQDEMLAMKEKIKNELRKMQVPEEEDDDDLDDKDEEEQEDQAAEDQEPRPDQSNKLARTVSFA